MCLCIVATLCALRKRRQLLYPLSNDHAVDGYLYIFKKRSQAATDRRSAPPSSITLSPEKKCTSKTCSPPLRFQGYGTTFTSACI